MACRFESDHSHQAQYKGDVVELADTQRLERCASAWGFKSLHPHQILLKRKLIMKLLDGITEEDIARTALMYGLRHGRLGADVRHIAKKEWQGYYNKGFVQGRREKDKVIKAFDRYVR